jgi:hypothetical protein
MSELMKSPGPCTFLCVKTPERINRFLRNATASEPEPCIRWKNIVRVEALATDLLGSCEVSVTFHYSDASAFTLFVHHKGYDTMLEKLLTEFPCINPNWYDELCRNEPWHTERVLYPG